MSSMIMNQINLRLMDEQWSPDGLKREEINTKYIKDLEEGCYFTTHGRDKNNLRFAIRVVRDEEIIEGLKKLEELWRS